MLPADASNPVDGPPTPSAVRVEDAGEFLGEWEIVTCNVCGDDQTDTFNGKRWVIASHTASVVDATTGVPFLTVRLRPHAAASPLQLDVIRQSGRVFVAAFQQDGDDLVWRWSNPEKGVMTWTLRRMK
jgi:hypothetical protein